jgi:DNA-directed RNA polymerase subunit D
MEKINSTENTFVFKAKTTDSLANAIRRYLGKVPTLAIEEVEISKNDSALYDETVAHRMGLISIRSGKAITSKTEGKMVLKVKKEGMITAKEMSGDFEVVYPETPITFLSKEQEVNIKAKVSPGIGSEHSKYMPGLMFYRDVSEITMDKSLKSDVSKFCPEADIKEKGEKISVVDDKEKEICDICEGLSQEAGKESTTELKDELVITIESFGQLDVKDMFTKAIDVLRKDLAEIPKSLK